MLAGDFVRKLRILNPELRIACGNDDSKPAGIFWVDRTGTDQSVCGIDKNYIPEWIVWNDDGSIRKGGWRRALKILIDRKLVDRRKAESVFGVDLTYRQPRFVAPVRTDINQRLKSLGTEIIQRGNV